VPPEADGRSPPFEAKHTRFRIEPSRLENAETAPVDRALDPAVTALSGSFFVDLASFVFCEPKSHAHSAIGPRLPPPRILIG
jgi:hypothetical protein